MSQLAELLANPPVVYRTGCKVCTLVAAHEDRVAILAALADPRWGHATLAKVLMSNGVPVGESAVAAHRRRGCQPDSVQS